MKRLVKKLAVLGMAFIMLFSLTSCVADIDGKHKGLSIGFTYYGHRLYTIMCAVKSDKHVFDVEDVSLDLYFGWCGSEPPNPGIGESRLSNILAFYIKPSNADYWIDAQDDYRHIENQYLLTEITAEEFATESFAVNRTRSKGNVFGHSGTRVTIPKETFNQQAGILELYTRAIWLSDSDGLYHSELDYSLNPILIAYHFVEDNMVRLNRLRL